MSRPDRRIGRRSFLQGAAAAIAGGAVTTACGPTLGPTEHDLAVNEAGAEKWGRLAGTWTPSLCNMCGGQCGILVHVANGAVEKIEPNSWSPTNYTNISSDFFDGYTADRGCKEGGAICPKGNAGIMQLYDPDRVKTPLKRTNPDRSDGADPRWQKISWNQALDEIATKLKSLRDAGEAHKLVWISEDAAFTDIQSDFNKLYGTPNYLMHSNLCDVARKASFSTVMGDSRPLADFIESKYILLFGWNPTSAIKWVHLPRIITRAIEQGARMVVVDPYMSDTAVKAQEWVPIRPATDGALALALAHVIIRDKLYNSDFVQTWSVGFDDFAKYVADKTPQWAEQITTVKAATTERLAHELATTKPALVDAWSGPGQHSNGVQGGRAIAILNSLIGSWDQPGGMMMPERNGPAHPAVKPDAVAGKTSKQPRLDRLETYPLGHSSGVYTELFANIAGGSGPYQPKVMFSVFQNPLMSVPGRATVVKAIKQLETFVVIDTMLSETAKLADYVLPGTNFLERYDLMTQWVTWSAVGLRQPVVKPLFGQLAEYETVVSLARRLGLQDGDGKDFFRIGPLSGQPIEDVKAWYEDYLSNQLKKGSPGITLEEMKALPGAIWVDRGGTRYRKYAESLSAAKLATAYFDGDPALDGTVIFDKQGGSRIGVVVGRKTVKGFATKSRKVEFSSPWLAAKPDASGKPVDPLPVYQPREWQPDKTYPLFLINWKEASHTHTRTQNNPWLLDLQPNNPLMIHPDTAQRLGIQDGAEVWVESKYGKVKAKVNVTERIHPEVVGLQHGFGHTALGSLAKGRGTADGTLRPTKGDPLSGQAMHKECCVRVTQA